MNLDHLHTELISALRQKGLKLGLAESCTGGLFSSVITSRAGSSEYFLGGIVSYANAIKSSLLQVSSEILDREGAVSKTCCEAMALGALNTLKCDVSLAITGIAGPDGGSSQKPVGTVWIGVALSGKEPRCRLLNLLGNRDDIRLASVLEGMKLLLEILNG